MHSAMRAAATACAAAVLWGVAVPAEASSGTANETKSLSFIDALSAIPEASKQVARTRKAIPPLVASFDRAYAGAKAQKDRVAAASDGLHEAIVVRTRAELAVQGSQESIDDSARVMYTSGGSVPTLPEVLLTADSPVGLAQSLFTRQYLTSVAGATVARRLRAEQAVVAAVQAGVQSLEQHTAEAVRAAAADAAAVAAARELTTARKAVVDARAYYRKLMRITSVDRSAEYGKVKKCGDWVTKLLSRSGFEGEDLREAWAIVMRESGGREDAISVSNDLGLFQINTATWRGQPWFNRKELLTRKYNAKIGHLLSQGGRSWYSWGLDGHGRPDARAYVKAGWTPEHIMSSIVRPYIAWYQQYPCRPSYESGYPYALPAPRADEKPGADDQYAGDGLLPGQRPTDDDESLESDAAQAGSGT